MKFHFTYTFKHTRTRQVQIHTIQSTHNERRDESICKFLPISQVRSNCFALKGHLRKLNDNLNKLPSCHLR